MSAGISSSTRSWPSASPRSQPNVVSAEMFIEMMRCSWSTVTIGSATASTIAAFSSCSVKGDRVRLPCRPVASRPPGKSIAPSSPPRRTPPKLAPGCAFPETGLPGCAGFARLPNYEVDVLAGQDNRLCDLGAVQVLLDLRRLARKPLLFLLRGIGRHFDPVAQLSVHLHDQLEGVRDK